MAEPIKLEDLIVTCESCEGRGSYRKTTNQGLGSSLSESGPCPDCQGRGFDLTESGEALMSFLGKLKGKGLI